MLLAHIFTITSNFQRLIRLEILPSMCPSFNRADQSLVTFEPFIIIKLGFCYLWHCCMAQTDFPMPYGSVICLKVLLIWISVWKKVIAFVLRNGRNGHYLSLSEKMRRLFQSCCPELSEGCAALKSSSQSSGVERILCSTAAALWARCVSLCLAVVQ